MRIMTWKAAARDASRGTAWLLAALVAAPASGGEQPRQSMLWETFVQLKPGTAVVLVLHDGERIVGRLLEADPREASVVDFTGRGSSDREQKLLVRELLKARRGPQARAASDAPAAPPAAGGAALVRRVARDDVSSVHVRRGGRTAGRALKVVAIATGVYFLTILLVWVAAGAPSLT